MMDSDDDDIYPTEEHATTRVKKEDIEDGEEEGEEVEDDSDVRAESTAPSLKEATDLAG